jgi:hypothetical protein
MKYFIHIDENKYVVGYNQTKTVDDSFEYEFLEENELTKFKEKFYSYKFVEDKLVFDEQKAEEIKNKGDAFFRFHELKKLLSDSDYKITKCYEASLLSEEMPYNLQELLTQRKSWRAEINTLEATNTALEQSGKEEE